jgi:hypothetical protein
VRGIVAIACVLVPASARADAWEAGVEAGAELDSNVHRVEVDPSADMPAVAEPAALGRAGGRIQGNGDADRWGRWALSGQGLVRAVASGVRGEDVAVAAAQGGWDHAIGERSALIGARASLYDVFDLNQLDRARAFSLAGADLALTLAGERGARLVATAGGRDFRDKPDPDIDRHGVALGARFTTSIWAAAGPDEVDDAATLDLAVSYRLERRGYRGFAFTSGCAPGEPAMPSCFVPTSLPRNDLHHIGEAELTYTGGVVAGAGYQAIVNDSSSYGQSLVRHRLTGSVTAELPLQVFATAIATLELDQHLDPLLVARDVLDQSFTTIDDENRSAVSVRLSRPLPGGWALEARGAFYADALSSSEDLSFRRTVAYAGLTWNSDE